MDVAHAKIDLEFLLQSFHLGLELIEKSATDEPMTPISKSCDLKDKRQHARRAALFVKRHNQ